MILLDGGIHVGWRRFRGSAFPIAALGIVGTFVTAAVVAVAAHYLLDFSWTTSWLIGAALAPTDPAVMFSVLGNREVGGRSGTILEGESGVNDPVGIALMIGIIEFAQADDGSLWDIAEEFAFQMVVGLAVGVAAGLLLARVIQLALPREGLYPIRVLIAAGFAYGLASVFHGSGFLAVFIAGLLIADVHAPYKTEIERFHTALASLAEIAVFIALGLTIAGPSDLFDDLPEGLLLALILAFVARPIAVLLLLPRVPLRWGERLFIMWGGLKGAVPILLAAFVLIADLEDSLAVYNIVFVVVAFSVIVQGSSIPSSRAASRVPMRIVEPARGTTRSACARVPRRSGASSSAKARAWSGARSASSARRGHVDQPRRARGRGAAPARLVRARAGDEVHVLGDPDDERCCSGSSKARRRSG